MFWKTALTTDSFDKTKYYVPVLLYSKNVRLHFKIIRFNSLKAATILPFGCGFGKGTRIGVRRRWKMNPEAFMLLDRLEKLMCSPQSQHHSDPFRGPVASMSRGWKGTLLKFGGEVGEDRVHLEDTFSVPLGAFQPGWPTPPTLWPDSLSKRVPSVCTRTGPPWPRLSLWIFLRCVYREACGGSSLNMLLPLLIRVTQDSVELSDSPVLCVQWTYRTSKHTKSFLNRAKSYLWRFSAVGYMR